MAKSKRIFLTGLLSLILLTGCAQGTKYAPLSAENTEALFGENVYTAIEALGADADAAEQKLDYTIELSDPFVYHNKSNRIRLGYDKKTDSLLGCYYSFEDAKTAYEYAMELYAYFIKKYGEPDTYPGLSNSLSCLNSLEDAVNTYSEGWIEDWNVNKSFEEIGLDHPVLRMNLNFYQNEPAVYEVGLRYYQDPNYPSERQ